MMVEDMRSSVLALFACGLLADTQPGPPVGARMPEFELQDQSGKQHSLKSLLGPKGAVIVFFRSADW